MGSSNGVDSYKKAISEFDNYIKEINTKESKVKSLSGYLISLTKFNEFKQMLQENDNIGSSACFSINRMTNIKLTPENTKDLIKNLNNNHKYIIINDVLAQKICKENINKISYTISKETISFKTESDETFEFKNNKDNIISNINLIHNSINNEQNISNDYTIPNPHHQCIFQL